MTRHGDISHTLPLRYDDCAHISLQSDAFVLAHAYDEVHGRGRNKNSPADEDEDEDDDHCAEMETPTHVDDASM